MRRAVRVAGALALAAGALRATACNAILGNEVRTLDEQFPDGGGGREDVVRPDVEGGGGDGPACDADTTSDRKNCGACGHDCLGGECKASKCAPFLLAGNQKQPSNIVVADGVVYWTNGDGTVHSCPTAGCNNVPKQLTSIDAGNTFLSGLDVSGGTVLVTGYYSQALHTCPTTGCTQPTTLIGSLDYPVRGLLEGTQAAFWINANTASVNRCALPTCAGGATRIASGPAAWRALVQDDKTLYWLAAGPPPADYSKGILYRAPKTQVDGGPETVLSDLPFPKAIVVKSDVLYMALQGGDIKKVSLGAGLLQFSLVTGEAKPTGITVDDAHVYWTTSGGGAIRRCAVAGCEGKAETVADGQNEPNGPVVTADAVYWTEYLGGTVKGVAK